MSKHSRRLVVPLAATLLLLPVRHAGAQTPEPEANMVAAVIASLAEPNRRIYLAPGLELPASAVNAGLRGRARHNANTLEHVQKRFNATIAYPEEVMECPDASRPETCTIPGDGVVFFFVAPSTPIRNDILPVRVILYHNGRGEGGQILREAWDLLVRRSDEGWTVVQKRLFATANGPA